MTAERHLQICQKLDASSKSHSVHRSNRYWCLFV